MKNYEKELDNKNVFINWDSAKLQKMKPSDYLLKI